MSKKDKLIKKFLKQGNDFEYSELVSLLKYLGFREVVLGKTTGSAVCFENERGARIRFHKPHPDKYIKQYVMKKILQSLQKEGLI